MVSEARQELKVFAGVDSPAGVLVALNEPRQEALIRAPPSLAPLEEQGVIDEVICPLMSGKEADVFLVMSRGERRVAKVYKEATRRSFKHRADYTEGRQVRDSRRQRAIGKRSRFGREQAEEAWRNAEVDAIYRLRAAGVRVPEPYDFVEGVLVMELVKDAEGEPAPRLVDVEFSRKEARKVFEFVLREVVKMLCAGLVHGDLSDFNVLMSGEGPVIIDFPQATDAAGNRNAKRLLIRDVENLTNFLARFDRSLHNTRFGEEMWDLYERGELEPFTELTGKFNRRSGSTDVRSLLDEIEDIEREVRERRESLGLPPPGPARKPLLRAPEPAREARRDEGDGPRGRRKRKGGNSEPSGEPSGRGRGDERSQGGRSDGGRSQGGRSDGGRSDGGRSDGGRSDGGRSDGGRSDGGRSSGGGSDRRRSDGGRSDDRRSDGGRSDGGRSDGGPSRRSARGGEGSRSQAPSDSRRSAPQEARARPDTARPQSAESDQGAPKRRRRRRRPPTEGSGG